MGESVNHPKSVVSSNKDFPVVCVGGSAGGLDAFSRLLENLPANLGVAIVIVNHITTMPTMLHQVLPNYTTMPVELITENLSIKPNHVFIIPANRDLHVTEGQFHLKPISKPRGWPDVITVFLRSLTEHWDGQLLSLAMMVMALMRFVGLKKLVASPSPRNLTPLLCPVCRNRQSPPAALILSCHRKISLNKSSAF